MSAHCSSKPSLHTLNGLAGLLHGLQALAALFVTVYTEDLAPVKLRTFTLYQPLANVTKFAYEETLVSENFGRIGYFCVAFFFLSAAFHACAFVGRVAYEANIERHINPLRWYEYALSSSIMIVAIQLLVGCTDVYTLLVSFALNAAMNFCGLWMERLNAKSSYQHIGAPQRGNGSPQTTTYSWEKWEPFVVGSVLGVVPWIVVFSYFGQSAALIPEEVRPFVYGAVWSYFGLFLVFPVNMVWQYWSSPDTNQSSRTNDNTRYRMGERNYILLSLVAKTVLAWLILVGGMRGEEADF